MGQSLPPPAAIDLVDSYARVRGTDVELVLGEPQLELPDETTVLVLRKGRTRVLGTARIVGSGSERRLVGRAARTELTDGTWAVVLRTATGPAPLEARLLVQGERPLVLLWGTKGSASVLPVPRATGGGDRGRGGPARSVARRALAVLPDKQAEVVRRGARRLLRRG